LRYVIALSMVSWVKSLASSRFLVNESAKDARDLTQETMLKAITYRNYYTPQTNFKAWVFTIMRNLFINQYRRRVKSGAIFDHSKEVFLIGNIHSHEDSAIEKIGVKDINRQINLLGEEYQAPFEMHFEGFKYKEIADKLGIPIGTVKSRIFIARKKLMEALPEFAFSAN